MNDLYGAEMREADVLMGKTIEWMWNNLPDQISILRVDRDDQAAMTIYNWLVQLNYIKEAASVTVGNLWTYIKNRKFFKRNGIKLKLRKNKDYAFFTTEELKRTVINHVDELTQDKLKTIYNLYYV